MVDLSLNSTFIKVETKEECPQSFIRFRWDSIKNSSLNEQKASDAVKLVLKNNCMRLTQGNFFIV